MLSFIIGVVVAYVVLGAVLIPLLDTAESETIAWIYAPWLMALDYIIYTIKLKRKHRRERSIVYDYDSEQWVYCNVNDFDKYYEEMCNHNRYNSYDYYNKSREFDKQYANKVNKNEIQYIVDKEPHLNHRYMPKAVWKNLKSIDEIRG